MVLQWVQTVEIVGKNMGFLKPKEQILQSQLPMPHKAPSLWIFEPFSLVVGISERGFGPP